MKPAVWRIATAIAVLALLAFIAGRLASAYLRNLDFERRLNRIARQALELKRDDVAVRAAVTNAASQIGVPVSFDRVRIKRAPGRLEIEILYQAPVKLPHYTVDLHFRARGRAP